MKFDRLTWIPNYKKNLIRSNKLKIPAHIIIISSVALLIFIFFISNLLTVNQATVLGVAGSTIFAIAVFFLSDSKEETLKLATARKNALVLSQILDHISNELSAVSNGQMFHINYPQNWLSTYSEIASHLDYDYLSVLIKEFAFVDTINEIITKGDNELAKSLIQSHWQKSITYWHDFTISDVRLNLSFFSNAQEERKHWSAEKRYRDFYDAFINQYSDKVFSLTIEYLKQHNGGCDERDASSYVVRGIKSDPDFELRFGKVFYDRELLLPIFHIHLDAEANSDYSLCWGELTLKSTCK